MSKYRIQMNGKVYEMEIELIDEKVERSTHTYTIPNVIYKNTDSVVRVIKPEADKQTSFDGNTVVSPIPGTIIKLMVNVGEEVEKDKPVLVLEAMKMENEVYAPHTGKIKQMFVTEGQTVQGAAPLFEMEE